MSSTLPASMSIGARVRSFPVGARHTSRTALWRVFCGGKEGVAIQTTVGNQAHFGNVPLRQVKYAEPRPLKRTLTIDDVTILKRPFFDFEKEARAIFRDETQNPKLVKGEFRLTFPFDPAEMLESVAIGHPEADISLDETAIWAIDDHAKPLREKILMVIHERASAISEAPPIREVIA